MGCAASRPVSGAPGDLQAHGSDERIWLARVEPSPAKPDAKVTVLFVREKFEPVWRRLPPLPTPVVGLASRGSQLAILLENGEWRLTTDTAFASGRPLPGGGRIVALGSDAGSLWAVGRHRTATDEAPATTRSSAPTTATAPSNADSLVLYRLAPQGWDPQGPLPAAVTAADPARIWLGTSGGMPVVAHQSGPRAVRIHGRTVAGEWKAFPALEAPEDISDAKLLGGASSPVIWARGASGAGWLWLLQQGGPAVRRELDVPNRADHAVAFAHNAIRVLWIENDKILERPLAPDTGLPTGDVSALPLPAPSLLPAVSFWTQLTLLTALVFALAASMRRRREMLEIDLDPDKLGLAPYSTRLVAGVIDAVPLLAAFAFARSRYASAEDVGSLTALGVGLGVYLLLTTLVETFAGRSLGKLLTGLYVVGLDGKPAPVTARLMRNVLRVIDLPIMPLALILFSPLRQRAGDLAAGTLVVRGKAETRTRPAADEEGTRRAKKDADSQ
jgi:uncharacterized RDD family membrane protein YckC